MRLFLKEIVERKLTKTLEKIKKTGIKSNSCFISKIGSKKYRRYFASF